MFQLFWTNIDSGIVGEFNTLEEAKARGRQGGFEFVIIHDGKIVGSYSMFGGWRTF